MSKTHKNKPQHVNQSAKSADQIIRNASQSDMHASSLIRQLGRSEHVLSKYAGAAPILRGEQVREPTPPVLADLVGLTPAEKTRAQSEYSAEYFLILLDNCCSCQVVNLACFVNEIMVNDSASANTLGGRYPAPHKGTSDYFGNCLVLTCGNDS